MMKKMIPFAVLAALFSVGAVSADEPAAQAETQEELAVKKKQASEEGAKAEGEVAAAEHSCPSCKK